MKNLLKVVATATLCLPALVQTHRSQVSTIAAMQSGINAPGNFSGMPPVSGSHYSVNVTNKRCDGKGDRSYAGVVGMGPT